mmetsp:Transcript_36141/g.87369  ORF Transcript_36141/g.87369 Transcript_36141/m.87369 type:complete len:885 (+) Transcript_36141:66-2720(+)
MSNDSSRNTRKVIKTQRVIRKRTVTTHSGNKTDNTGKSLTYSNDDSVSLDSLFQRQSIASSPFLVRFFCFEVSLMLCLGIALVCHQAMFYHKAVLHPYLQTLKWTPERAEQEETYYRFECTSEDITAETVQDLFVTTDHNESSDMTSTTGHLKFSPTEAVDKAMTHGAVVLPQLLSSKTASNLRQHVGKRLRNLDQTESIEVIMGDHRWSFALRATEHVSVANALRELGNHPFLQQTIEGLVGKPAALMELQVIVSIEGAPSQFWHADSEPEGSSARFGNSFVPLYTLLIPLQDTTAEMGATAVCPGTHRCHYTNACLGFGDTMANASNWTKASGMGVQVTDPKTGIWKAGTGLLYNSQTQHHGSGHVQGEARAALLLSFSGAPRFDMLQQPKRLPTIGTVYAIHSNHLGFLFDDLKDPFGRMQSPWKRTLGWLDEHQGRGWSMPLLDSFRTINEQFGFRLEDLTKESVHGSLQHQVASFFGIYLDQRQHHQRHSKLLAPMEDLMVQLLERIHMIGLVVALAIILLYLWGMSVMPVGVLQFTLLRLLIIFGLLCWYNMSTVAQTNRSAQTAKVLAKAEIRAKTDNGYNNLVDPLSLVMPRYQDILFPNVETSDRSVGAQSLAIDYYHPGTKRWHDITTAQTSWFLAYSGLHPVFQEAVLVNIVDLAMTQEGFRFLERNPKTSDWSVMKMDSILQETRHLMQRQIIMDHQVPHLGWIEPRNPCDRLSKGTPICRLLNFENVFYRESKTMTVITKSRASHPLASKITPQAIRPKQNNNSTTRVTHNAKQNLDYYDHGTSVEFLPRFGKSRKWINGIIRSRSTNGSTPPNGMHYTLECLDVEKIKEYEIPHKAIRLPEQLAPLGLFLPKVLLRQEHRPERRLLFGSN